VYVAAVPKVNEGEAEEGEDAGGEEGVKDLVVDEVLRTDVHEGEAEYGEDTGEVGRSGCG
jgi:hypothetical protein